MIKNIVTIVLPYGTEIDLSLSQKFDTKGFFIELLYSKEIKAKPLEYKFIKFRYIKSKSEKEYYNLATIIASSKWICFFNRNITSNNIQTVINTAITDPRAVAIVGNNVNYIFKKFGIRNVTYTLPIIFNRNFLVNFIPFNNKQEYIIDILKHADKLGNLFLLNEYNTNIKNFKYNTYIIRPYYTIIRKMIINKYSLINNKLNSYIINYKKEKLYKNTKIIHFSENIPVFINCRDRFKPLMSLLLWLETEGMQNIILIDNNSSYPPLIDFYDKTNYTVLRLGQNIGHKAPWDSGAINLYAKDKPYIVTDPDVIPDKNSHGAIKYFVKILNKYKECNKVGFGLRIDNIPDCYDLKENVIQWESKFWENQVEPDLYDALLDTTFALYRPNTPYTIENALRTGGKYVAEHEPWYADSSNPSDEVRYYRKHANKDSGTWGLTTSDTAKMYI